MTIRQMPRALSTKPAIQNLGFDLAPKALDRWNPSVQAAGNDNNSISIFDVIGSDPWTGEGVTVNRIAAALRKIGENVDVTVNINSPGGDVFEGLAIYNLLREHGGNVTVKILGLAASAASLIAMAGDRIQIAKSGFFMVHNSWVLVIGNRHDLRETADVLEPFDVSMAGIYAARTGGNIDDVQALMDAETWIGGNDAVDKGFADELLPADQVVEDDSRKSATGLARNVEAALRKSGLSHSAAKTTLYDLKRVLREGNARDDIAGAQAMASAIDILSNFSMRH